MGISGMCIDWGDCTQRSPIQKCKVVVVRVGLSASVSLCVCVCVCVCGGELKVNKDSLTAKRLFTWYERGSQQMKVTPPVRR
jgi:hypothetical protein